MTESYNKKVDSWLKRNKWYIIGVIVVVALIVYATNTWG